MSKIALEGNASGTGTFTLASPNSSTDRTLTLPDESGTVLTSGGAIDVNASAPADSVAIDSSGNVGIGTTSPAEELEIKGSTPSIRLTDSASSNEVARITNTQGDLYFDDNFGGAPGNTVFRSGAGGTGTERMRIDSSGNLLVGQTSQSFSGNGRLSVLGAVGAYTASIGAPSTSGTYYYTEFRTSGGTQTGYILSANGTGTTYSTTSDYRLKENIQPLTNALEKITALKPVTYTWKSTGQQDDGFIAHELAEVCPNAVVGEKDAVNEDGSIKPQGVDTSFLVATLTAAIQELKAINDAQASRIETLEAKVAALEAK